MENYKDREGREQTVRLLLERSKSARYDADAMREECCDYYRGRHRTAMQIAENCKKDSIPWISAMCPDPYIHVESQVVSDVPDFTFRGRDGDSDDQKAKSREYVVRYILESSGMGDLVAANERRCIIGGTAVWKVFWDGDEVRVIDVDPACIFPDPAAKKLDDCEYVCYCYPMHRRLLERTYGDILRKMALDPYEIQRDAMGAFFDWGEDDSNVIMTEHWYRDDEGGISCSIMAGGHEVRHIENYWGNTNYRCFPFVLQYRTQNSESIWGMGDIEPIINLVDAVDRELSAAQLTSAFSGNDIILAEHDAFSMPPSNRPGAIWELKPGAMGKVARLGGMTSVSDRMEMTEKLRALIQEAVGNFDVDMGKEPSKITSATGLAQLIERSDIRKASKKAERLNAFRRILELCDRTALEFYDEDRTIFIGAGTNELRSIKFSAEDMRVGGRDGYFPEVDTIINTGDGLKTSKAFVMSALDTVLGHQITEVNYPLVSEILGMLQINDAQAVREHFKNIFKQEVKNDE